MFQIEGIDHVAISVRDQKKSIEWYRDVLGLERRYQEVWGDMPAILGAGTTSVAMFPRSARKAAAGGKPAFLHLAFRVDAANFERAKQRLEKRDIEFTFQDHDIAHSIYFYDPDGFEIEITTYEL